MTPGVLDILVILLITIGPTKAAAFFVGLTAGAEPALKRRIAIRSVVTAAVICGVFVLIGEGLLSAFHISLAALKIAGGLVLLLFALHLVLGEERKDEAETGPPAPSLDIAVYPLAMPLMATPQGLVAIVTLAASMRGGGLLLLLALVLVVMVFNLFFMLFADRILGLLGPAALKVVLRVFGLLLCGLAVQLMILGFRDLGLIELQAGGH